MWKTARLSLLILTFACFAGCNGSDDSPSPTGVQVERESPSTPDNTPEPEIGDEDTDVSTQSLGSFDSSSGRFQPGVMAVSDSSLAASESTGISVSLVGEDGNLIAEPVDVFFNSSCIATGLATIEPAIVRNSSGTVNATYTTIGCDGDDRVRAQTALDGKTLNAEAVISATPAPLGSIIFESSSLNVIGIKGSGGAPEAATVTFRVTNSSGGPVQNLVVDFTLNNTIGGISLANNQGVTNANGLVSTTVNAGEVATTVVVTATATQNDVTTSARSRGLAITTGIPDQNSLSLSAETLNIEGLKYDGVTTVITARMADRYNNPVADGTAVNFVTEGGNIEGSCVTENGACSVTLTSQAPRPVDGRVTVRATAVGEESFADVNPSNGLFDDGDTLFSTPEAFLDENANGVYDQDMEPYVDFNQNNQYDDADGLFDGLLCNGPGLCGADSAIIFKNLEVVFSGSRFNISATPDPITLNGNNDIDVIVHVVDENGQKPPAGTRVSASVSQGSINDADNITGILTKTMIDDNSPGAADFIFTLSSSEQQADGKLSITVTTPKGDTTESTFDVLQP